VTTPQTSVVRVDRQGAVGIIVIDNPPVNANSQAVRQGLLDAIAAAEADSAVDAIVIDCDGRTFVAGGSRTRKSRSSRRFTVRRWAAGSRSRLAATPVSWRATPPSACRKSSSA
jgi:enoyl-CoA hydratase/carnithine racemase